MKPEFLKSYEFWAVLFAFIAAMFWFLSAYAGLASFEGLGNGRLNGVLHASLEKTIRLNAAAAFFSGLTAMAAFLSNLGRKKASQPAKSRRQASRAPRPRMNSGRAEAENAPHRLAKPEAAAERIETAAPIAREDGAPRKRNPAGMPADGASAKRRTSKGASAR